MRKDVRIVTRDAVKFNKDDEDVAIWEWITEEGDCLYLDDAGCWACHPPHNMYTSDELQYKEFKRLYGLKIKKGEKKTMEIKYGWRKS